MTDPQPTPQEFPTYRVQEFLPSFLLGWGLGTLVTFAVRALADALLTTPCEGRTLLALIVPLLLGPGGWRSRPSTGGGRGGRRWGWGWWWPRCCPRCSWARVTSRCCAAAAARAATSCWPRRGDSISSVTLRVGESRELTGRIGGFTAQDYPGEFTLSGQGSAAGIVVTLPKTTARAGEVFPLTITVQPGTGINTYTAGVQGRVVRDGRTISADGTLEVNVRPAEVK
ncbi:hypothetical protein ACFP9V_10330 [Deinococcus radiopugnans]|uniref:hypothetical protein n=1 Tax=Deinococcus radiopugnans TaxID=57497 RepID=UPI0036168870